MSVDYSQQAAAGKQQQRVAGGCAVACERAGGKGTWGSDGQRGRPAAKLQPATCLVV